MRIKLLFILFFWFLIYVNAKNQLEPLPASGLLWKISGNGLQKPSYLFGTYHAKGGMQILDSISGIEELLLSTNALICESEFEISEIIKPVETKNQSELNRNLKPWPNADSTYNNLLNGKQKFVFDSIFNSNNTLKGIKLLNLRPLSLWSYMKYFYKSNQAKLESKASKVINSANISKKEEVLDSYLQLLAKGHNMDIIELEPKNKMQEIKVVLSNEQAMMSYKKEIDILMNYLVNQTKIALLSKETVNKVLSAYLLQDIAYLITQQENEHCLNDNLGQLGSEDERNRENAYRRIVDDRNDVWMTKIPSIIKKKSSFIAVGASHLPGDKGLVNQLRELGYDVENISERNN